MVRLVALLALALVALLAAVPPSAHAERLYVSLTFDDGTRTQYDFRDVLNRHGVKGTYYANSGKVGLPGYMTWDQLLDVQADGHEIGGHTRDHRELPPLTRPEQVAQVCDDRAALIAHGLDVTNFAYPHGRLDAQSMAVVRDCGYDTARTTGGTDEPPDCCFYANPIPLGYVYDARAVQTKYRDALEAYREVIELGRDFGGGWLPIVLHDVCAAPCTGVDEGDYYVSDDLLDELIRWILADPQLRIRTTAHVMAINDDDTPPSVELTAPVEGASFVQGETVALAATASDEVGVERVEFYAGDVLVGSDDSAPYEAAWDAGGVGEARLRAVAFDEAGHVGRSSVVTVSVQERDVTPPSVELTAPVEGASFVHGDTVALAATASDARSAIEHVEFLVDGVVVHTDTSPPYAADWDSARAAPGTTVALAARARDVAGNVGTSAARTVTVARSSDPDPPRPPDPDPPRPPDPDPPRPPDPDPPRPPQSLRDATAPRVRVTARVGRGRRLVVRVVATDPSGVGPIRLLINGRTARTGVRVSGAHTRTARLVRSERMRPGRYVLVAVATDRRGNRAESQPVRVLVRR